jgi:hypothetical protein
MGGETNSLRSDKFPLFFHFSHRITGWLQAERPNWLAAHRLGSLAFGVAIVTAAEVAKNDDHHTNSVPSRCEASQSGIPACEQPVAASANRIKKGNLSERSEFVSLPDLCATTPGTPKGLRTCGRLLLLTFLGEARKVSGCRAAPG